MKKFSKNLKQRLKRYEMLFKIPRKLTPEERLKQLFRFYDFIIKIRQRSTE